MSEAAQDRDAEARVRDSFGRQSIMATIGASVHSVRRGEVEIVLPFANTILQQHGFIHAGAIATIADSACGYAAMTRAPPGAEVVTAEFKVNLLRPAIGDRFLAVGKVEHAGKRLTVCKGEVRAFPGAGPDYKVIALMLATFVNVPGG